MNIQELIEEAKKFENNTKAKRIVEKAWRQHKKFLSLYPFREHPENISLLTPDKIFKRGEEDYFFLWIEHKLRELGHLWIGGSQVWESVRNQPDKLKELLKTTVDDSVSLSQKIDAHWEDIKWFGGDRHIAKKQVRNYIKKIVEKESVPIGAQNLTLTLTKDEYDLIDKHFNQATKKALAERVVAFILQGIGV